MTIKIVTDSTAKLSVEEIKKYDIHVVPLTVKINDTVYKDGVDINSEYFLTQIKKDPDFNPTTSQPATGDFVDTYNELTKNGDQVLSIHITSLLSGTAQGAYAAASQSNGDISVIDSKLIERALGEQVILAAQLVEKGKSIAEITEILEETRKSKSIYVFLDSLDALEKGGRISRVSGMLSKLLKVKIVAKVEDENLKIIAKGHGKNFFNKVIDKFTEELADTQLETFSVTSVEINPATDDYIKETLIKDHPETEFSETLTSPIIMSHTGYRAFAIIFSRK